MNASAGTATLAAVRPAGNTSVSRTGTPTGMPTVVMTAVVASTGRATEAPDSGTCTIGLPSSSFMTVSIPA